MAAAAQSAVQIIAVRSPGRTTARAYVLLIVTWSPGTITDQAGSRLCCSASYFAAVSRRWQGQESLFKSGRVYGPLLRLPANNFGRVFWLLGGLG